MQKRLLQLLILVLIISSMAVVSVMADEDETRNACDVGGTLEGQCETEWEWIAGWYLIRYEEGVFTMADIPGWVNAILPEAHNPNSGFVSGFDFNDPSNPNTGNFGNGDAANNVGGGTGSGTGGGNDGGTPPPPPAPASCTISFDAFYSNAWGIDEHHTVSLDLINGISNGDAGFSWEYQAGDTMMMMPAFWYLRYSWGQGSWSSVYTFENGQSTWTTVMAGSNCPTPTPPQQVP